MLVKLELSAASTKPWSAIAASLLDSKLAHKMKTAVVMRSNLVGNNSGATDFDNNQ